MVIKNAIPPKGSSADNMSIRQDVTILSIDHKPRGLTAHGQISVEGARLTEMDRYDTLDHPFQSRLPLGRVSGRGPDWKECTSFALCAIGGGGGIITITISRACRSRLFYFRII